MQLCLLQLSIHSETAHFSKRSCRYARERSVVFLKLLINSQCSVKLRPREDLFFCLVLHLRCPPSHSVSL